MTLREAKPKVGFYHGKTSDGTEGWVGVKYLTVEGAGRQPSVTPSATTAPVTGSTGCDVTSVKQTENFGGIMRYRFPLVATLAIAAAWLLGSSGLHAQTCKLKSNGMCANPRGVCSPIDNPDKSSASKGNCNTKVGTHPIGNTCECKGKLDTPPPPPDHVWDLVPSKFGTDPNGFLRMPNWKWAAEQGPVPGALFDVCDFCPCNVGTWGFDAPDNQEPLWLGAQSCTHGSSLVTPPLHENSNNLCSGGPAQTIGSHASGIGYHMNWEPVEYEGPLNWEGHSTWTILTGDHSGDNEYNFNILRPELFLVANENRRNRGIHLEFNSTETVDNFDDSGTWWDHPFHHDWVDAKDDETIQSLLGMPWGVVLGILGLDMAHTDHHAELHPVYAMFIRDPPGAPAPPPHEVRYAFFVRNWGVEGSCGKNQEQLWIDHIDVQLPDRKLGTLSNVRPYRHSGDVKECPKEWFHDPNGVFRFPMASPDKTCGFVGEITMVRNPFTIGPGSNVSLPGASEEEQEVSPQAARIKKLSASDLEQLNQQMAELTKVSGNQPAFGEKIAVKKISSPFPHAVPHKATVKVVPDLASQQLEEKKRRLIEEFLQARSIQ